MENQIIELSEDWVALNEGLSVEFVILDITAEAEDVARTERDDEKHEHTRKTAVDPP